MKSILIIVLFLLALPRNALVLQGISEVIVICSEITDCGKSEQN